MKKIKLALIGAGGHAVSCIDVIEKTNKYKIVGLVDNKSKSSFSIGNKTYKVINEKDFLRRPETKNILIAIGSHRFLKKRSSLFKKYTKLCFKFPIVISPLAYVSKFSTINEGTIVMHEAIINANTKIGSNCILNSKSLIEHDCNVGNNTHIATSAIVNGHTKIHDDCFIGSNSTLLPSSTIKKGSLIKANQLIKK